MATIQQLSCSDGRLPLSQRNFTYTQKDPNDFTFCDGFTAGCLNPFTNSGQGAIAGTTVFSDNCKVNVNGQNVPLTCKQLVNYKLNEAYDASFVSQNLYRNGCGVFTNSSTGRRETGCSFSDAVFPTFVGANACDVVSPFLVVDNCTFQWVCTVTEPDATYKPVCCNSLNGYPDVMGTQTDPYTGLPFDGTKMCGPNWCLGDPAGECLALFNASCSTTSSCFRHALLSSKFPVSTTNLLVNTIVINNGVGQAPQGFQCADYFEETKRQASFRTQYDSTPYAAVVNNRVASAVNIIKVFCGNPETKGNGDCACINAYIDTGALFADSSATDALTFQLDNANIPAMLEQTGNGLYRRVDAFCAPSNFDTTTQNWIDPLTYTLGGTTYTISNVCSQSGSFWFNSKLEYTLPTVNPNRNLNSLTNFGDVVNDTVTLESFRNLGQNINFAMPLHCWHPACVGNNFNALDASNNTFLDLLAFTQTCPNICYMYSGADLVNIGGNVGSQTFIHINNDYQTCQFAGQNSQYVYQPFPFALPSGCQQLVIQAPVNFSDTIHITVTNPQTDISSLLASKTMFAFSNLVPLVSFNSNSSQTSSFGPSLLYKYSYSDYSGSTLTEDTIVLSVTVDTTDMSPFTSYQSEINLTDNSRNTQQIQVQVYVYPDAVGTGGTSTTVLPLACGEVSFNPATGLLSCTVPCDCTFGSNSTQGACTSSFNLVDPLVANTTGFTSDGDPIVRPLRQLLAPQFGTGPITRLGREGVALAQALKFG
jgi:hypothetical protein